MSGKNISEPCREACFSVGDKSWLSCTMPGLLPEAITAGSRWSGEMEGGKRKDVRKKGGDVSAHPFCIHGTFLPAFPLCGRGTSLRGSLSVEARFSRGVCMCVCTLLLCKCILHTALCRFGYMMHTGRFVQTCLFILLYAFLCSVCVCVCEWHTFSDTHGPLALRDTHGPIAPDTLISLDVWKENTQQSG